MPGLRILLTLLFAAVPLAAQAEGVNFTVPPHYLVEGSPPNAELPAVFRVWGRYLNGARHSIVVSSQAATTDLKSAMDANLADLAARHAIDLVRTDGGALCGMPSVQIAYAYEGRLTYVFRYAVVGDRLLTASYAHPRGSDADPSALAALDTLCSGIHQPATPKGWIIQAPYPPNANAWHPASAPEGKTMLMQHVLQTKNDNTALAPYTGPGTVVMDRRDACGAVAIRRHTVTFADGSIYESSSGTVNGYDYFVSYARQASEAADPGALAVLTSFCEHTLPPS